MRRALQTALAAVTATWLAACSSTTPGAPLIAHDEVGPDGAVIAAMFTGPYATTPSHPVGAAGDNVGLQATLEGHRLGPFVTGPWQAYTDLVDQGPVETLWTGPIPGVEVLRNAQILSAPFVDVAAANGFFAGFDSFRVTTTGTKRALMNFVMEFPDPAAAGAAADAMAAINLPPAGGPPGHPVTLMYNPDVHAMAYDNPDGSAFLQTVVARGPMVLYTSNYAGAGSAITAEVQAGKIVGDQQTAIARFVPTDPAKRAALQMDPTGDLYAHTLAAPDNASPFIIGEWEPAAWLHFEVDPITANAHFDDAGLEVVSQRLATVYRTQNADGARRLADAMAADIANLTDVQSVAGVPGLPSAKCFVRTRGFQPATAATTWRRVAWRYKCVAHADRYAYTAFSNDDADVHQQMSAQYRILVGR